MKDSISHRINKILTDVFNGNKSDFARAIGVGESNIRSYIGGTIPKMDVASRIVENIAISCEWLLTGNGEMIKSDMEKQSIKSEVVYKSDPKDIELIASNRETIETQKDLITSLKLRIKELEYGSYSKSAAFHTAHSAASTGEGYQENKIK